MAIERLKFYSKNNCVQCMGAARTLASTGATGVVGTGLNVEPVELTNGLPVEVIKVDAPGNEDELQDLKARGFSQTPVLSFEDADGDIVVAFSGNDVHSIHVAVEMWRNGED